MRTLDIKQEFDSRTFESPHELMLDGVNTGVRWNGDTKKDLYGDNPVSSAEEEFALILVLELDHDLRALKVGIADDEKAQFYNQILAYLNKYPN